MNTARIVVVGAGPAGMMASLRAAQLGREVLLLEKNPEVGKKLLLSGKGRCNLTNLCSLEAFLQHFSHRGDFLRDSFKKFFNTELIHFFESRGLPLKVERQSRVFPVTNSSLSVVDILKKELSRQKVRVLFGSSVKGILREGGKTTGVLLSGGKTIVCGKVILATGGASYRFTGSAAEGFKIAAAAGHRIAPLKPGLVPLETKEHYPLQGLVLKNIRLEFSDGRRRVISEIGELLFTHSGISGPLVLSASSRISDWLGEGKQVYADIDLKPALSREQLDSRLCREFKSAPKKSVKNVLQNLLPMKLIPVVLEMKKIPAEKKANQITQQERISLIDALKEFRLHIIRTRPLEEAMVTRGGIVLNEINPRTMESRLLKGLYFAGEIIDVDADTGGFNLQAAFSTGYLAGESAALGENRS